MVLLDSEVSGGVTSLLINDIRHDHTIDSDHDVNALICVFAT